MPRKTKEELEKELLEQISALRASSAAYDTDSSNNWEAKRLSSTIYILCHEGTGRTKSLLGLTGRKKGMQFLSSAVIPPSMSGGKIIAASGPLIVNMRMYDDHAEYIPKFDNGARPNNSKYRWLSFRRWWEEIVFHPVSSMRLTRKNIVFSLRSQDGGAHVDASLTDEGYATFRNEGDPAVRFSQGAIYLGVGKNSSGTPTGKGEPIKNGAAATMRQIAWEVDQSLKKIGL